MANEHLQRIPLVVGNRSTYTWSGWIKRNSLGDWERLFSTTGQTMLQITGSGPADQLRYFTTLSSSNFDMRSTALLRDVGSWMHIVFSVDHTNQHSKNRARIYVNGAELDDYATDSSSNGSQNEETYFNSLTEHALLGRETTNAGENFRGEAFDIFWVDGQALTPDVFGFYKDGDGYQSSGTDQTTDFKPGQWSPRLPKSIKHTINRSGGFGVNGFYLPLNDGSNFGADFHCTPNSIIKLKGEDEPQPRNGAPTTSDAYVSQLRSDPFAANLELAIPGITGGQGSGYGDYHADIKGSGSNRSVTVNGDASIIATSSYYGSAMSFDGNGDYFEVDTPVLGSGDWTIEEWINQPAGTASQGYWDVSLGVNGDSNTTGAASIYHVFQTAGSGVDGEISFIGKANGYRIFGRQDVRDGCWHHVVVEKYNNVVTLYIDGVKKDSSPDTYNYDSTNNTMIGASNIGQGNYYTGQIQDVRVYIGVAKYKGGFDVPIPYSPQSIATRRATVDSCKNNFVTMNSNNKSGCTLSNGNLTTADATSNGGQVYSTMGSNTGKWYYEAHITAVGASGGHLIGINPLRRPAGNHQNRTVYRSNGDVYNDSGVVAQSGTSYTTGDIIGVAWDADNKNLWFAKNGSWVYSGDPANGTNPAVTSSSTETQGPFIAYDNGTASQVTNFNFGQNPTLGGQVTAGTNTDGNGKGLFKYAPPTGFLALCDDNLPTPAVADPGKHFKTVVYSGDSAFSKSINAVGFKPDLVWVKCRSDAKWHALVDSVRGNAATLFPNASQAQSSEIHVSSFSSDGFTVSDVDSGTANHTGMTYVAWCWKAGGPAVTNNDGSATSLVSANQEAGFSIVKFTAQTSGSITLGHGLGKKPAFWLWKDINGATGWYIFHKNLGSSAWVNFDSNDATTGNSAAWGTDPTDTVFTNGSGFVNQNDVMMYIWAEIEGYSKFAQYFGNGSATGPFVYCGFKPAWLLVKCVSADNGNWVIYDSSRSSTNVNGLRLGANIPDSENENNTNLGTDASQGVDFLSNGFKIRTPGINHNQDGEEYIFAAFAESPFQTANAK